MGTLRRSKQRTDAFLLARPAGSLSNFKESSKRACSQATSSQSDKKWKYIDKLEVTNARKLLPRGQNFGIGCSKSGYNPWIIQN
jgi:hypothetical protein